MAHQKHSKLSRPQLGNFGRNEWAILGTPCGNIKKLSHALIQALPGYQIAYVDADHKSADESAETGADPQAALSHGAALEYTDKITFSRFDYNRSFNSFEQRAFYQGMDLVLVNGNHFSAQQQVVVIDPRKEASLQRKLDRLSDVKLFVLQDGVEDIFDFLKEAIADWKEIPQLSLKAHDTIAAVVEEHLEAQKPPVKALVLLGGKSTRMGQDKAQISYHGKPQALHMAETLQGLGVETYLSVREDQENPFEGQFSAIKDSFLGLGPFGGILSAFREDPNAAWLVTAVDLPLLDHQALQYLLQHRDPSKVATAFHSPVTNFPEPLICLWEPRSYSVLLQYLAMGYSCPRKALINSDIALLQAPDARALTNVNTPEEFDQVIATMRVKN